MRYLAYFFSNCFVMAQTRRHVLAQISMVYYQLICSNSRLEYWSQLTLLLEKLGQVLWHAAMKNAVHSDGSHHHRFRRSSWFHLVIYTYIS